MPLIRAREKARKYKDFSAMPNEEIRRFLADWKKKVDDALRKRTRKAPVDCFDFDEGPGEATRDH